MYCQSTNTVKNDLRFNFFQVQTAVYQYIGKPFHQYNRVKIQMLDVEGITALRNTVFVFHFS